LIQQLLGDADPGTTTIYTTAHANDLAAARFDAGPVVKPTPVS
jgi:site-specific recombinase XerD